MSVASAHPAPLEGQEFSQVKLWAWIGAFWYVFIAYTIATWIGEGAATFVNPGDDIPAMETLIWIITMDILGPICAVWVIIRVIVMPKLKSGSFSSDGLLVMAFFFMFWQDPLLAYSAPWFLYNSLHFNLGNWVEFVPGALSPNSRFISEPLLTWSTAYIFFMFWPVMFVCWAMKKWKNYRPHAGVLSLVAAAFLAGFTFDIIMELIFLHTGGYAYIGSIQNASLFGGQIWQFPLYEIFLWGGTWGLCGAFRYFKDDKGYMFCERGVDKLQMTAGKKTFIRFLAISGLMQTIMIFWYNAPMQWFGTHGDAFPEGVPSYLMNGICGEGTQYACPAPSIPLPRGADSISVGPDLQVHFGKLPAEDVFYQEITN